MMRVEGRGRDRKREEERGRDRKETQREHREEERERKIEECEWKKRLKVGRGEWMRVKERKGYILNACRRVRVEERGLCEEGGRVRKQGRK